MSEREKVGILGVGMVGGTMVRWFLKQDDVEVILYDKYKPVLNDEGCLHALNARAEIVFVCVPTPYAPRNFGGYDDSAVWDAVGALTGEKIVVIRSTVLPGTTQAIQDKYPQHQLLFVPEFLTEAHCDEDFANPVRRIVGFGHGDDLASAMGAVVRVEAILPTAEELLRMPAKAAELAKLVSNYALALRVTLANELADMCEVASIDYMAASGGVMSDPRIGSWGWNVEADDYRGYGGHCLPKDTKALIDWAQAQHHEMPLLELMDELNDRRRREGDDNAGG